MMASAANQLDALKQVSVVVADTGDLTMMEKFRPQDATTNPSLVLKAVKEAGDDALLRNALADHAASGTHATDPARPYAPVNDLLCVTLGAQITKLIPGRVSTEVDATLSFDTEATIQKARRLIALYEAKGVSRDRVYIKIAATWEGIQACKVLEAEGIRCNMTLVFSFAQAVACGEVGASLISPFVGRVLDWFKAKNGDIYTAETDPGVVFVSKVYAYFKKHNIPTIVMAASFRNADEIRQIAGCDYITIAPSLLAELEASTEPLPRILDPATAGAKADPAVSYLDERAFRAAHAADPMAVEKLEQGIKGFTDDGLALEGLLADMAAKGVGAGA